MGRYVDIIRQVEEAHSSNGSEPQCVGGSRTGMAGQISIGSTVTWQGADLTLRRGIVDFLHTDTDGTKWVFVTFPGGWSAVNIKHVVSIEPSKARNA